MADTFPVRIPPLPPPPHMHTHMQYASGNKLPRFNPRPKVRLHRQDNWKTAHEYMKAAGINVRAIEPAGLFNKASLFYH